LFNDEKRTHLKVLLNAIERNNWEDVQRSLNQGVDIDAKLNGYTPLHLAVKKGSLSLVYNLLSQGAIFNAVVFQEGDKTPLDVARYYHHHNLI
jgi:ankyrin repeat protein